jgi:hypothetical protein
MGANWPVNWVLNLLLCSLVAQIEINFRAFGQTLPLSLPD